MTRVLITGITGFIGSEIARRLSSEGYEVFVPKDLVSVSGHNMLLHKYSLKSMEKYIAQVAHSKEILKALGG